MTTELFPSWLPVAATAERTADGRAWLERLPSLAEELRQRWAVRLGAPFPGGSCSWVAPAVLPDGDRVVLKISWPHRENSYELADRLIAAGLIENYGRRGRGKEDGYRKNQASRVRLSREAVGPPAADD